MALVALAGAGCTFAPTPTVPSAPTPSPAAETPSQPSAPAPSAETPPVTPSPLPVIDTTWKTYTNKALGFSFQSPTKGIYAPTWGVTFLKSDDPKLKDGCYQGEGNPRQNSGSLQVGDTTFCVTRFEDAGAGQRYDTDYYVGGLKGSVILMTFSKHFTNDGSFDIGVYNAVLDQIVGTYTHE